MNTLTRTIQLLFWLVLLVFLVAFLLSAVLSEDIAGQTRPTPPATSVPPPLPARTPTATSPARTSTAMPTDDVPTMDVSCKADRGAWLCTVWVYPGHIVGLEALVIENYGNWFATFQYLSSTPDGWGVAARWATIPSCSIEFAELQLMEMEPPITARVQQVQGQPPSPTHARYSVSWHCTLLPEIH